MNQDILLTSITSKFDPIANFTFKLVCYIQILRHTIQILQDNVLTFLIDKQMICIYIIFQYP